MKKLFLTLIVASIATTVWSQGNALPEGSYKPECDMCTITFNKDMTFEASVNICEGYEKITGTYKINGNDILLTTKDFDSEILFTLSENKDQIIQTRRNQFACGNCDEGDSWTQFKK